MKRLVILAILLCAIGARAQFSKVTVLMEGVVLDEATLKPIGGNIEVLDATTRDKVNAYKSNKTSGVFSIVLKPSQHFIFRISSDGYFTVEEDVKMPAATKYEHITRDFSLKPAAAGAEIPLAGRLFDFKKKDLRVGAEEDLEDISRLMKLNPNAKISITSYPDLAGNEAQNLATTKARADAVKEYLITQGIDQLRIRTNGSGAMDPSANLSKSRQAKGKHPVGKVYLRVDG